MRYDIFCRVVDNFGDIGVCWRLTRQLHAEHGIHVRLFVDDLSKLNRIEPRARSDIAQQNVAGIEVLRWADISNIAPATDCVIEAFGCALPEEYEAAMAARMQPPVWLNLEYLSAESWVASHHLAASLHPRLPLTKYFFFPGFTEGTGGLICEQGSVNADAVSAHSLARFSAAEAESCRVFLFGYENNAADALVQAIRAMPSATITVPEGSLADSLSLNTILTVPFVAQSEFDAQLACHHILFVRGEDSFVRAQWAARPFVWQIYPQEGGAHWLKLNAFLDLYCADLESAAGAALRELWRAWNAADSAHIGQAWDQFLRHRQRLSEHAQHWAQQLRQRPDLASQLVTFVEKTAKI